MLPLKRPEVNLNAKITGIIILRAKMNYTLVFLILMILLSGCSVRKDRHLGFMIPFDRTNPQAPGVELPTSVSEKEKNGIFVSTMAALGRSNLLMLSIAVINRTDHMIHASPDHVYLAVNRGFLIPPISPDQVVNRRMRRNDASTFFGTVGSIPYQDPYGVAQAASSASSLMNQQTQAGRAEVGDIAHQRLFKSSHLPPGFATQGLLYYDPVGYEIRKAGLPITILIEVENEKFLFEFLPSNKKGRKA